MNEQNPMRWREPGAGAPDGFRELLDSAALDEASPARLSRFVERATSALGTTPSAAPPVPAGALPTGKLVAGVLAVAGGAALLWVLSQGGEPTRPTPARRTPAVAVTPSTLASPAVPAVGHARAAQATPAAAPSLPPASAEQPVAATEVSPRAPARREPGSAGDTLAEEVRLLQSAREALSGSPGAAYRFAEQHRTRFPRGALAQEREVLAIESLLRQGRQAEARSRADRFREAYPRSGHLDRFPELRDNPPQ